jgi:hypothetical protein
MSKVILPIAAALAALSTVAAPDLTSAATPHDTDATAMAPSTRSDQAGRPNMLVTAGEDLLGLIVTKSKNGTVLADHYSHVSHASHASHHSHYSSRY